ncbi:hypothetical protein CALVIDRAFT_357349 [Calocera viscosa TUFC12733]|uniref:Cytochrome P450 n=1 Tax=Calocera viscosa (strain TUFC12733) TaxID=1330018 RepID=A0A167QF31_CALVF|nr:hypothetical protein CALVIDRAFT_357349 [Calocera viscosa TUFC12733]
MVQYPEVQRKAQAELDSVIGRERPPTIADRDNLSLLLGRRPRDIALATSCNFRSSPCIAKRRGVRGVFSAEGDHSSRQHDV